MPTTQRNVSALNAQFLARGFATTMRHKLTMLLAVSLTGFGTQTLAVPPEPTPAVRSGSTQKPRTKPVRPAPKIDQSVMQSRWQEVQFAVGPTKLLRLAEQFERDYPFSAVDQQNQALQVCAKKTLDIARSSGISSDFFDEMIGDERYKSLLKAAVRGDKESAYLLALAYQEGSSGVPANARRSEQWLRFAAELDHAQASWRLAEIYNREGLMADAARYEKRATDLGYVVPVRLPNRGY